MPLVAVSCALLVAMWFISSRIESHSTIEETATAAPAVDPVKPKRYIPNEWHPPQSAEAIAVEVHTLSTTLVRADALPYQFCIENPPKKPQDIKQCDALIATVRQIDERLEKQVKDW